MKLLSLIIIALAAGMPAHAYVGPGAGLGAIAASLALLVGVLLLLVGFIWYPLKRLIKGRKRGMDVAESPREG